MRTYTAGVIGCVLGTVVMGGISDFRVSDAYRQGQIDALSGTVKYQLVDQPDGSRDWERVEGVGQ